VVIPENVTRVKADLVELFSNAFVDGINKYWQMTDHCRAL
jgi:hypothetical protein